MSRTPTVGAVAEVELARLREWPENPRTISSERFEALKRAMLEDRAMLWARPVLHLPNGTVFAGNIMADVAGTRARTSIKRCGREGNHPVATATVCSLHWP